MKMIADKSFPYRGRQLKVGEAFDADEEHVSVFTLIGHAHVEAPVQPVKQAYLTRDMKARSRHAA